MSRMWSRVAAGAVATAATLTLVNGGTSAAVADESSSATTSPGLSTVDPAQDGRDLFRGVFFFAGPQGTLAAEVAQIPDDMVERNQTAEAVAYIDAVVAAVDEIDPAFFTRFAGQMRSGDPFAVEQAIADGQGMVGQANDQLDVTAEPAAAEPAQAVWAFVVAGVAIAVLVSISLAVVTQAAVLEYRFAVGMAGNPGELGHEQTVAALAEAFAA